VGDEPNDEPSDEPSDEPQHSLPQIAPRKVTLHRDADGLVISLQEFGFFDSGAATIKSEPLSALDRIASILAIRTYKLRIEGHTDNIPIHTAQMMSNWELSTARATELVRLLILRYRFAPERLGLRVTRSITRSPAILQNKGGRRTAAWISSFWAFRGQESLSPKETPSGCR
jgi:outer membrane protein OmpA-like peptidoglycan-associated protein